MLDKKFGLTVAGSKYEEVALMGAYFALTGDAYDLDLSGRNQKLQGDIKFNQTTANIKGNMRRNISHKKDYSKKGFVENLDALYSGKGKAQADAVELVVSTIDFFVKQKVYNDAYQHYSQGEKEVNLNPEMSPLDFCESEINIIKFKQGMIEYTYSKNDNEVWLQPFIAKDISTGRIEYDTEQRKAYNAVEFRVWNIATLYQFAYQLYLSEDTNDKIASETELKVLGEAYYNVKYWVQWEKEMQAYLNSGISSFINKTINFDNTDLWKFVPNNYERLKDLKQTEILRDTMYKGFPHKYKDYLYSYYYNKVYNYYKNKKR